VLSPNLLFDYDIIVFFNIPFAEFRSYSLRLLNLENFPCRTRKLSMEDLGREEFNILAKKENLMV